MKTSIQIYTLLIVIVFSTHVKGQNTVKQLKDNISPEAKIASTSFGPNSITRTIKQDKKGNIWFATWEGIIRYQDNSFTNITSNVSLSRFFSVLEDHNGNFWFGSIGSGVYYYDGKSFRNFTTKEGLASNSVTYIYEDKAGNIWFGTDGGASRYDGTSFRNFTTKDGLPHNDVNTIIEDNTGTFWIGTRGDACFYDGKTFTTITHNNDMTFKNVRSIIEDQTGNIWFGGNDGLWSFDGASFRNFTTKFVGYIYEDKKGNIWTSSESSTTQGWALSRYDAKSLSYGQATVTEVKTVPDGMFFGILEAKDGSIWFGTLNGVYRYDGHSFNNFKNISGRE